MKELKKYLNLEDFKVILKDVDGVIQEKKNYLCEIDSFIGDGDHGMTIASGFNHALEEMNKKLSKDISSLFIDFGMAFMSATGGVTGPIFGNIFISFGKKAIGKEKIFKEDFLKMLEGGLEGIKNIGGAKIGEKTIVDAFEPATLNFQKELENNSDFMKALESSVEAARIGMISTKEMIATKGRSKYLGERSKGFIDAGATSFYLMLDQISKSISNIFNQEGKSEKSLKKRLKRQ